MTVRFECQTMVPAPPGAAFALALSVELHTGSMAKSREVAIGGRTAGILRDGEEVTWRAWHFGLPWTMTSRITEYDPPWRFVDEQVQGPFRSFRHVHLFNAEPPGTRMIDQVEFIAPFGPAGVAAERLVLARYLRKLIVIRNSYLAGHAAGHAQEGR